MTAVTDKAARETFAALRAKHKRTGSVTPRCAKDGQDWPCDTIVGLDTSANYGVSQILTAQQRIAELKQRVADLKSDMSELLLAYREVIGCDIPDDVAEDIARREANLRPEAD